MLVTITPAAGSSTNVPSLSSASTTNSSPRSHTAPLPISFSSPPTMKEGRRPASTSTSASIDDVVVFPWVPDTATVRRVAQIAARISARRATAMPAACAATTSGFRSGIAVETATRSAPATRPRRGRRAPRHRAAASRCSPTESLRSEPDTRCPIAASTEAIADIPAPPTPTTCTRIGTDRSIAVIGRAAGRGRRWRRRRRVGRGRGRGRPSTRGATSRRGEHRSRRRGGARRARRRRP